MGGALESTRETIYNITKTAEEKTLEANAKKSFSEKATEEFEQGVESIKSMVESSISSAKSTAKSTEQKAETKVAETKDRVESVFSTSKDKKTEGDMAGEKDLFALTKDKVGGLFQSKNNHQDENPADNNSSFTSYVTTSVTSAVDDVKKNFNKRLEENSMDKAPKKSKEVSQ